MSITKLFVMYIKFYWWNLVQKFMLRSTEESSSNSTDLSVSESFASTVS